MLSIFNLVTVSAVTGAALVVAMLLIVLYKYYRKKKGIANSTSDCSISCMLQDRTILFTILFQGNILKKISTCTHRGMQLYNQCYHGK